MQFLLATVDVVLDMFIIFFGKKKKRGNPQSLF